MPTFRGTSTRSTLAARTKCCSAHELCQHRQMGASALPELPGWHVGGRDGTGQSPLHDGLGSAPARPTARGGKAQVVDRLVECEQPSSCRYAHGANPQSAPPRATPRGKMKLIRTGATLLVCPSHLVAHWQAEIKKHTEGRAVPPSCKSLGSATTRMRRWRLFSRHPDLLVVSVQFLSGPQVLQRRAHRQPSGKETCGARPPRRAALVLLAPPGLWRGPRREAASSSCTSRRAASGGASQARPLPRSSSL